MRPLSPSSKPIISIFVHCFPPAKGGVEFLVGEITKILQKKYLVHVFTGKGLSLDSYKTFSDYTDDNSVFIHRLPLNQPFQRIFNKFLHRFVVKFGILSPFFFGPILKYSPTETNIIKKSKLIFGLGMPTKLFYDAYLFAKKFHKPLISLPAYHNISYYNHCPFFQQVFNYAQKVIFLTKFEKQQLLKNYHVDPDKLVRLTFCPFSEKQIKLQQQKNRLVKINLKNPVIGFVGQICTRKNLYTFRNILNRGYNVLFAGAKTANSAEIENFFKHHIKTNKLKIIYNFPNRDKENIYKQIDFFVNPSIEESLGIVNFEAIFYGKLILISPKSAFYEFLPNPKSKQSFYTSKDLLATIKKLQQTPIAYRNIVDKQYNIFAKYNMDIYQKKLINLFDF